MSRLSILIPFVGNTKLLEDTLVSVLENRPDESEVLVVLGRRYEDPYELGDEVRFLQAPRRTNLVGCLNLGIGMCRSEVVHILACGTQVVEGWAEAALGHFADPRVACVAPLVLDARCPDRVIAAGVEYHPGGAMRLLGTAMASDAISPEPTTVTSPHSAAAFYRKSALERIGRFEAEAGDRWALLDMGLVIQRGGFRTVLEPQCQVRLVPAAADRAGSFRRALDAERFFWRWGHAKGWSRSLALHALTLAAEGGRRLLRPSLLPWMAGRLVGSLSIGNHGRCRRRVERAARLAATNPVGAPHFAIGGAPVALEVPPTATRR